MAKTKTLRYWFKGNPYLNSTYIYLYEFLVKDSSGNRIPIDYSKVQSPYGSFNYGGNAFDANVSDSYSYIYVWDYTVPGYIQVEMPAEVEIGSVELYLYNSSSYWPAFYAIELSPDGVTWPGPAWRTAPASSYVSLPLFGSTEKGGAISAPTNGAVAYSGLIGLLRGLSLSFASAVKGFRDTRIGSATSGLNNAQVKAGVLGTNNSTASSALRAISTLRLDSYSGLKGSIAIFRDLQAALRGYFSDDAGVAISGSYGGSVGVGIVGGGANIFGVTYPLSSLVPLRTSLEWGSGFSEVKVLPIGYGTVTLTPVQYDMYGYEWFLLDHAIEGVDKVVVDDKEDTAWDWSNKVDSEGRAISVLKFNSAKKSTEVIQVTCRGKMHPVTGKLMTNPADVMWDFLSDICNLKVALVDFDRFRAECGNLGIELNGMVSDNTMTIRGQLDQIMLSVGGIWSGGMPGMARVYPL